MHVLTWRTLISKIASSLFFFFFFFFLILKILLHTRRIFMISIGNIRLLQTYLLFEHQSHPLRSLIKADHYLNVNHGLYTVVSVAYATLCLSLCLCFLMMETNKMLCAVIRVSVFLQLAIGYSWLIDGYLFYL